MMVVVVMMVIMICGVTTRSQTGQTQGPSSSRGALPYNVEPKAWCKSVFTVLLITI